LLGVVAKSHCAAKAMSDFFSASIVHQLVSYQANMPFLKYSACEVARLQQFWLFSNPFFQIPPKMQRTCVALFLQHEGAARKSLIAAIGEGHGSKI